MFSCSLGVQHVVHEFPQVVAGFRLVVVDLSVFALGGGPGVPAVGAVEDVAVLFSFKRRFVRFVLFQAVEVFQEQQPRGLFGVVQFGGAAGFFSEDIVDVFEGLLERGHGLGWPSWWCVLLNHRRGDSVHPSTDSGRTESISWFVPYSMRGICDECWCRMGVGLARSAIMLNRASNVNSSPSMPKRQQ